MSSFLRYVLPPILWAAVIFYFSSLPQDELPGVAFEVSDLAAHFGVYLILGFLLARAFMYLPERRTKKNSFISSAVGILYGASDEFHQMFVPGRYAEWSDFLADLAGVCLGTIIYIFVGKLTGKASYSACRNDFS